MIKIHEKLSKGETVDPQIVSTLLLAGVINITSQHDALEGMGVKIRELEHENVTNKLRIEALDNWVLQQNEVISVLNDKLSTMDDNGAIIQESSEIEAIKKKIISLEIDSRSVRASPNSRNERSKDKVQTKPKSCEDCGQSFSRNCDFEKHLDNHQKEKLFECDVCGKRFFLEWRLKKHTGVHLEVTRFCHYFNNDKPCPYSEIGCKFRHEKAGKCTFKECKNSLCQYNHKQDEAQENQIKGDENNAEAESINNQNEDRDVEIVEEGNNSNDESSNQEIAADTIDEIDTIEEYECHLCNSTHPSKVSREECCDHQECSVLECYSHRAVFKFS